VSNFVNEMNSSCTSNALDLEPVADKELLKKLVCVKGFATQIARSMSSTAEILDKFVKFIRKSRFSLSQLRMCTDVFNKEIRFHLGLPTFTCVFQIFCTFDSIYQDRRRCSNREI
jgi:hypothetical protein